MWNDTEGSRRIPASRSGGRLGLIVMSANVGAAASENAMVKSETLNLPLTQRQHNTVRNEA